MAEKRMFAKTIIDSDAFLDMPLSAQSLYFHLSMRADDDGFINNPKKIQRMIGASDDDAKLLVMKKFIIPFDSGVVVIKHWKIHNYIRKDTYKETAYLEEKAMLETEQNKSYRLIDSSSTTRGRIVDESLTQYSIDKNRLDKNSIDVDKSKPTKHKFGEYLHVQLTDDQYLRLKDLYADSLQEHIRILDEYCESSGKRYRNYSLVIQGWVHDRYMKSHPQKVVLDAKFYEQKKEQTSEEIQAETERLRREVLGA